EFRMLLDLLAIKWRKEVVVFSLLGGLFDLVLGFLLAFIRLFVPSLVLVGVRVLLLGPGRSVLGLVGVGGLRGVLGVGLGRLGFGRRPGKLASYPLVSGPRCFASTSVGSRSWPSNSCMV